MELFVLIWLVCVVLGAVIAQSKGSSVVTYALLGFFLGPLGVILAAVSKGEGN